MSKSNDYIQIVLKTNVVFVPDCSHELDVEENPNLTSEEAWTKLGLRCSPEPL